MLMAVLISIIAMVPVALFLISKVLGPAPADPDALNYPPKDRIVNGKLVSIEIIRVNGQEAPGRSLEQAIDGFSEYLTGDVRRTEDEPMEFVADEQGLVTRHDLNETISNRRYSGPSDIAVIIIPGLADYAEKGGGYCDPRPDGSHVVVIFAKRMSRRRAIPVSGEKWWHYVIKHELCHTLGVPFDRSHVTADHHCNHPDCILYRNYDIRSVLGFILRLGLPMKLCSVCRRELRSGQATVKKLLDPGDPYDDMVFCDRMVELNADRPLEYIYRAEAHVARKNYASAIDDYTKAIALDPKDRMVMCFRNRGVCLLESGQIDLAIKNFEYCLELRPDDIMALSNLMQIVTRLATSADKTVRDIGRAIELARHICELSNWKHPQALSALAQAYGEAGQFDQAVIYQAKAMTVAGEDDVDRRSQLLDGFRVDQTRPSEGE